MTVVKCCFQATVDGSNEGDPETILAALKNTASVFKCKEEGE